MLSLQAKKLSSERQIQDLSEKMETLLQEKKELELKNKILVKDLSTWQDHVEELWGREVQNLTYILLFNLHESACHRVRSFLDPSPEQGSLVNAGHEDDSAEDYPSVDCRYGWQSLQPHHLL